MGPEAAKAQQDTSFLVKYREETSRLEGESQVSLLNGYYAHIRTYTAHI